MMCGREVLLPLDLGIRQTEPTGNSMSEYTAKLSDQMEQIHQFACQHSKLSSDHQKKNYNHHPVISINTTGEMQFGCTAPGRRKVSTPS